MKASLVITTYNWKEALDLVLRSVLKQSRRPDEVIVADDGSRDDTREVVDRFSNVSPFPVRHIWQEDKGFRAGMIRNKAIAACSGEYVVLIDGDMVLLPRFLEDHLARARRGFFSQGSRIICGKKLTERILREKSTDIGFFSIGIRRNRMNAIRFPLASKLIHTPQNLRRIRTCNFSFWREDALRVNGFDEKFVGWGREDSEFAVRLMNSGVKRQNLKLMAGAFHLYHNENSRNNLTSNDHFLARSIQLGLKRCELGIDQYL